MTGIDKQQANRLLVMKAIYDASEGSESNAVSGQDLLGTLGLSDQELADACKYLEGEHLIRGTRTAWGHLTPYIINITHRGIKEMEESLQTPNKPTAHFPPAISVIHVQGNLIGSSIQSGSPGAQQETTVRDVKIARATEEALTPGSKRGRSWRLILMVAVAGLGGAVTAILGVSRLDSWSLALIVFAVAAALAAVTYAITEENHRTLALWISNGLLAALLLGIAIYAFIGPSPARTANVVANEVVGLSGEAGASPAKEPVTDVDGQPYVFGPGNAETATCYAMVGSSVWLYFHFSSVVAGWAPFIDFHYQNGFPEQLPSHC
jgi:hypothetical protein